MEASTASGGTLQATEREWLARRVSAASDKAFPADERIGKTPQQDFYFRELLEVLIENALRYGTPCVGGNFSELWQFTRALVPKWRRNPNWKRGRSGYSRRSIKTLVHEWNDAFNRRIRALSSAHERIEFFFDTPDLLSDDVILRAEANIVLLNGSPFQFAASDLTSETRLPRETLPDPESESEKKQRLLREARKYARRVEADFLEKLSEAPLTDIQKRVAELRRTRNNRRALALAILFVVGTGMVAYKIFFSRHPIVPVFKMEKCSGCPSNIAVDNRHRVALKSPDGRRITEWADAIVGPDGSAIKLVEKKPDGTITLGLTVPRNGTFATFEVPQTWHERPEVVLQRRISCIERWPPHGCFCFMLLDLRSLGGDATSDTVTIGVDSGDGEDASVAPVHRLNSVKTRVAMWFEHAYGRDGRYEIWLVASSDSRLRQLRKESDHLSVSTDTEKWMHIASVRVEHGEVVHLKTDESSPATPAGGSVAIDVLK